MIRRHLNRREFLAASAMAGFAGLAGSSRAAEPATSAARLTLMPEKVLGRIPADFIGLGYEISSVGQRGLLSGTNHRLIRFVRTLGDAGVIRIGGDTSDSAHWSSDAPAISAPKGTVVNKAVISDLGEFLRATGWKLIWGLNLGSGTANEAVEEAQAVADAAGSSLLAFEIGNEPDLFVPAHRRKGFGYADFLGEYRRLKKLIRARLPAAPFAGPDVASATDWVPRFARDEGSDLKLLTHHYYAQGPPRSESTTIENLLAGKTGLEKWLERIAPAAEAAHLPYRFCEVNSCYHGGKPGVSDSFASALWVLDLMFTLASHGSAGINIETGINQLGRVSDYSPIYPMGKDGYVARPIYYGMLAFARAGNGRLIGCELVAGDLNVKAYSVVAEDGTRRVTLINKELTRPMKVRVIAGGKVRTATVARLVARSASSQDGVSLCGAVVDADGRWTPAPPDHLNVQNAEFDVDLPSASAAIVEIS